MSSDPAHVYVRSVQQRILRIALAVALALALIITPLIVSSSLRLDLAYRFGLAPGDDVEQIADPGSGNTLIVIPFEADSGSGRTETRYHAAYLARPSGSGIELESLDDGSVVNLPLQRLDFIAVASTGEHVLFSQGSGGSAIRVLVTVPTGAVETLPPDVTTPDLPGDWSSSVWDTRIGRSCLGISPQQTYIACFESPTFARYLAGDWQIDVHRYGQYQLSKEVFRGRGNQPVVGFTADDAWLYFQNELGIWREPMSPDMFGGASS
jgi:hypothetical protein